MVNINQITPTTYLISPSQTSQGKKERLVLREGLIIHGYGSNKEEILGLAVDLVLGLGLKLLVFDLPGHGQNDNFLTLANCLEALNQAKALLEKPSFFVGHSLGAYLGLMTELPLGVLISIPGEAVFEGSRQDLLRLLRVKRVKETTPCSGLKEILAVKIKPKPVSKMLMLRADQELKSVIDMIDRWQSLGFPWQKISGSNHLDIISSPLTVEIVSAWLKKNLI